MMGLLTNYNKQIKDETDDLEDYKTKLQVSQEQNKQLLN